MKRILTTAMVVGLVAVPSIAFASHGADDMNAAGNDVRQQDRQAANNQPGDVQGQDDAGDVQEQADANDVQSTPATGTTDSMTASQASQMAEVEDVNDDDGAANDQAQNNDQGDTQDNSGPSAMVDNSGRSGSHRGRD